jgi:lysophospholipase L1-like esterase
MQQTPAPSRPSGTVALSGSGGIRRRSPVEIVATAATYVTRTTAADVSGLRAGPFGRWADGVIALRADCVTFASHWDAHNQQVSAHYLPPWNGKLASECFHPSQAGYRDWARALLAAIPSAA